MGISFTELTEQHLKGSLITSLLSVWVLVALFFYLNLYTKRRYFTVWMTAWLFYALWLTLGLTVPIQSTTGLLYVLKQSCVALSATLLLWGSSLFLEKPLPERAVALFNIFLIIWVYASSQYSPTQLETRLAMFLLLGLSSVFTGIAFYKLRKKMPFIGAGLLSFGFTSWGIYLSSYPLWQEYLDMYRPGFLLATVLQLFIAVSMIILVLEEARYREAQMQAEIEAVRAEKEALQAKILCVEEECRSLYDRVRLTEGLQRAYEELRRTHQVLVQQERLRAIGQMASGIVHDVSNSLTTIIGHAELLLNRMPNLPDPARRCIQNIYTAANDITTTIAHIRKFYKRRHNSNEFVTTDLNRLVQEVVEITRPRWEDQPSQKGTVIKLHQELDPNLPSIKCQAEEVRDALINLIFNAVDALPNGGTIRIVTKLIENTSGNGSPPQKFALIEVQDNGIGMDEETKRRCLEPFYTTKAAQGGTGLGLSMVYGMVQRHNGNIEIESALGQGTTIRLTLPISS